jgi:hypothetical protein
MSPAAPLLIRPPLLPSLFEQIIQSRIDPSLVNVAPERAIGGDNPISPTTSTPCPFLSVSRWNERKVC